MSNIPEPFEAEPPHRITPPREEEYVACPSCGEIAWDAEAEFCSACPHYVEWRGPTPERREEIKQYMDLMHARIVASEDKCEGCDRPRAMRVTYPLYNDYSGKLLGSISVDLCVPCFKERHDENRVDPVFGKATRIDYRI